ncbi:acyl-CoA dehydrogenase family protein [Streptomyces sp. NPDC060035]|uniref:acyl-CoA dehydrogenase family protein n=1 Tax=Streptomyces sp. NPDC060035 TaxID=3347044 RepID=UPI00368870E8
MRPTSTLRAQTCKQRTSTPRSSDPSAELGRFGLGLPEEHGGTGLGLVERAPFAQEIDRAAARGPFLPTSLVGPAGRLLVSGLLSTEPPGVPEAQSDMTVEHTKARVQFGRPLGIFQAVKHKCATMAMHVRAVRTAASHAATATDTGPADATPPVCAGRLARERRGRRGARAGAPQLGRHD